MNHRLSVVFVCGATALLASCAEFVPTTTSGDSSTTQVLVKTCVVPEDQKGTFSGRWKMSGIPIALDQNSEFDKAETEDVIAAADSWNTFYQGSLGIEKVLDYGTKESPRTSNVAKPTTLCQSGIVQGGQFTGQVIIYKMGKWPKIYSSEAIAITTFCPTPSNPIPQFYHGQMEINYENFFVEGKRNPDLRSIVLHEFGHLLGLDHSCDSKGKKGSPDCGNSSLPDVYRAASLYYSFGFDSSTGAGEQRRTLNENDQGRGNCLYSDLIPK